jgi:hypothetical protein
MRSIEGYSLVGIYEGNGLADGPFVYCGFRPAYVMIKERDSPQSWEIRDSAREPFNDGDRTILRADESGSEVIDAYPIDLVSNGFKLKNSGNGSNRSGSKYIFYAVAESPFKYANAR